MILQNYLKVESGVDSVLVRERLFKIIQMRQICLVRKNLSILKIFLPFSCLPIYILTQPKNGKIEFIKKLTKSDWVEYEEGLDSRARKYSH